MSPQHAEHQRHKQDVTDQRHQHQRPLARADDREHRRRDERVERTLVARAPQKARPFATQDVLCLEPDDGGIRTHGLGIEDGWHAKHKRCEYQRQEPEPVTRACVGLHT